MRHDNKPAQPPTNQDAPDRDRLRFPPQEQALMPWDLPGDPSAPSNPVPTGRADDAGFVTEWQCADADPQEQAEAPPRREAA